MNVVGRLNGTEDMLECVVLHWITDDDVNYTNIQVLLKPKKPPAPRYDILDFPIIKSFEQVIRKECGIADDSRRIHCATHRFCLNRFVKLRSAEEKQIQDALEFD